MGRAQGGQGFFMHTSLRVWFIAISIKVNVQNDNKKIKVYSSQEGSIYHYHHHS
jgi:hypothetical protein